MRFCVFARMHVGWRGICLPAKCSGSRTLQSIHIGYQGSPRKGKTGTWSCGENELQKILMPGWHCWGLIKFESWIRGTNFSSKVEITVCRYFSVCNTCRILRSLLLFDPAKLPSPNIFHDKFLFFGVLVFLVSWTPYVVVQYVDSECTFTGLASLQTAKRFPMLRWCQMMYKLLEKKDAFGFGSTVLGLLLMWIMYLRMSETGELPILRNRHHSDLICRRSFYEWMLLISSARETESTSQILILDYLNIFYRRYILIYHPNIQCIAILLWNHCWLYFLCFFFL